MSERLYFGEHEWETVDAAMARMIPTDHEPGAKEAETVRFLDRYLSGTGYIYAKPDGSGFIELSGARADAWTRRVEGLRARYSDGIAELDDRARALHGDVFKALGCEQQDEVLRDVEAGGGTAAVDVPATAVPGEAAPAEPSLQQAVNEEAIDFVSLLALHTRQGFYADPIYGGNKDHVGWDVIGFPGPESLAEVHAGRFSTSEYFTTNEEA